jgi:hypothetical protein
MSIADRQLVDYPDPGATLHPHVGGACGLDLAHPGISDFGGKSQKLLVRNFGEKNSQMR